MPAFGTFRPEASKYYLDKVVDPVSGTHYDTLTGETTPAKTAQPVTLPPVRKAEKIKLHWDQPAMGPLIARYAGVYAVILALSALFIFVHPQTFVIPMIVAQTIGALLLPVMRVAPWADEDADDGWFLLLFLVIGSFVMVCGPAIALIFYIVLAIIRQNANLAVMGCLIVAFLARLTAEAVTGHVGGALFVPYSVTTNLNILAINWTALTTAAGWYGASVFHKLDE